MQNLVIEHPYRFVPPAPSWFWTRVARPLWKPYLHRIWGIESLEVRGLEPLRLAVRKRHSVILAVNHPRPSDPLAIAALEPQLRVPLFTMASWHQFHQGWFQRWTMPRLGMFSVLREGADHHAVRTAVELLVQRRGPLVIFPEGAISRHNDLLLPLSGGVTLVARLAARRKTRLGNDEPVLIFPVALKYLFRGPWQLWLERIFGSLETRLGWADQSHRPWLARLQRLVQAWLSLREVEHLGQAQSGPLFTRLYRFQEHLLRPLEQEYLAGRRRGHTVARVRALRAAILTQLLKSSDPEHQNHLRRQLAALYLAQQLSLYPKNYVHQWPTVERVLETAQRVEEDLTDRATTCRPWRLIVQIGEPIAVEAATPSKPDLALEELQNRLEGMLHQLAGESDQWVDSPLEVRSGVEAELIAL